MPVSNDNELKPDILEWLARRKAEGLKIDPETAETATYFVPLYDPYGVYSGLPEGWPQELENVVQTLFARAPTGDWIRFEDLPAATVTALEKKMDYGTYEKMEPCSNVSDGFDELNVALAAAAQALAQVTKALADWHSRERLLRF